MGIWKKSFLGKKEGKSKSLDLGCIVPGKPGRPREWKGVNKEASLKRWGQRAGKGVEIDIQRNMGSTRGLCAK